MEFLKKNYGKLIVAAILLVGVVLTSMLVFKGVVDVAPADGVVVSESVLNNYALGKFMMALGQLVFFAVAFVFVVLKMLNKEKAAKIVVFAGAVVALVLVATSMFLSLGYSNTVSDFICESTKNADAALKAGLLPEAMYNATINSLEIASHELNTAVYGTILNVLVYGILPVCYGVKKLFLSKND